jgi:Uma2 family endonuclease
MVAPAAKASEKSVARARICLVSSAAPIQQRSTYRDLDHTPDDGNRWELIDGEFHVSPFPTTAHQHAVTQLLTILNEHVRTQSLGRVFAPGLKVVLDEPTGVGPDVVYVSMARMGDLREDGFHGAPNLIVEVLSSKPELDRFVKFQKYAKAGVPHYWMVDPVEKSLAAYRLAAGRYELAGEGQGNARFESNLFPGLVIRLDRLWD